MKRAKANRFPPRWQRAINGRNVEKARCPPSAILLEAMEKVTVDVLIESKAQDGPTEHTAQDSQDEYEVKALNDTELREQLCAYGICPGPVLPSTRTIYEKKLLRLMKRCPRVAAVEKMDIGDSEEDEEKGTGEVVYETDNLKVTAECTPGLDNKPPTDAVERQKKLLSPDVEYSLAKIVAELQEILPEGKGAAHRFQGQRRRPGASPERKSRQKVAENSSEDYGYPDANGSEGPSTRRRTANLNPSGQHGPETKDKGVPETPKGGFLSRYAKIIVFAICIFIFFVFVM